MVLNGQKQQTSIMHALLIGCSKTSRYEGNLGRHITTGKYTFAVERETATDFAQKHYSEALQRSNIPAVRNAQQKMLGITLSTKPPYQEVGP